MKIQSNLKFNCSFGYRNIHQKSATVKSLINQITNPIRTAKDNEKKALIKALGLNSATQTNFQTKFESHGADIIGGEILPKITITAKGISPMNCIGNIVNVELARIKGQLKRISLEDLNL